MQIKNEPQPEAQQQPEEDLLAVSLQNARKFIVANWLHIVFALALVAAIAMAVRAYEYRRQSHVLAAWGELGSVPADELQFVAQPDKAEQMRQEALTAVGDVVQHPPEAAAMPWAQLQFGSLQADGGDWTGAARTFADLTTKYPLSEPVATARAALATSLEAQASTRKRATYTRSWLARTSPTTCSPPPAAGNWPATWTPPSSSTRRRATTLPRTRA